MAAPSTLPLGPASSCVLFSSLLSRAVAACVFDAPGSYASVPPTFAVDVLCYRSTSRAAAVCGQSFWTCLSFWVAVGCVLALSAALVAAATGNGPSPPLSAVIGVGSRAVEVDTDVLIECSEAAALFPDIRDHERRSTKATSSAASRPNTTRTHHIDGGSIDYCNADTILSGTADLASPVPGFHPTAVKVTGGGCPRDGPGRAEGSGLKLRTSMDDVFIVNLVTAAHQSLKERFDSSTAAF